MRHPRDLGERNDRLDGFRKTRENSVELLSLEEAITHVVFFEHMYGLVISLPT